MRPFPAGAFFASHLDGGVAAFCPGLVHSGGRRTRLGWSGAPSLGGNALVIANVVAFLASMAVPEMTARLGLQLLVLDLAELQRFAVLAVGGAEAVLVVVRLLVRRARVEAAVVALLQLDGRDACLVRGAEHLPARLEIALMVVADLGDHITVGVVADSVGANLQCACQRLTPMPGPLA